ncbi:MAG: hypothetical protein ACOYYS_10210 [Chloroflexota bacterium]
MKRKTRIKFPEMPKITETRLVNAAFALGPWITPVITAWLVFNATREQLGWGWPQALISAAIIETNGISSTNLLLYLYRTKAERKLLLVAGSIVGVYAFVVLALTVVLDTFPQAARYAPILFVFLVLSSNATVAVRAHHKTVLADVRHPGGRKRTQTEPVVANPEPQTQPEAQPVTAKERLVALFQNQPEARLLPSTKLAELIGCSDTYIRKVAHRNGDGGWAV